VISHLGTGVKKISKTPLFGNVKFLKEHSGQFAKLLFSFLALGDFLLKAGSGVRMMSPVPAKSPVL